MVSFIQFPLATDPIYSKMRDGLSSYHVRGRQYLDSIWQKGAQYVDPDAAKKATHDLVSVFWELQLAHAIKSAGKALVPRDQLSYTNNEGPDLFAADGAVWLEAVVVRCGTGPDALQYPEMMKVYSYNADGVILRIRSAICDKSKKLKKYINDGIIKPGNATVIAISGVSLPHRYSGIFPPEIVRAVYAANNAVIEIDRVTKTRGDSYIEYRDRVKKRLGAEVATDIFLQHEFAHVSAVLYGEADWVNPSSPPGADFKLVHNPRATAPLPDGWLPVGDEYWWREGDQLESRRHS